MKFLMSMILAATLAAPTHADEVIIEGLPVMQAADVEIEDFLWLNRVLVIFAATERDPAFTKQIELLAVRPDDLAARNVVVLLDTDPKNPSSARTQLRPRGFSLVLIDLDGTVKLRKPAPWSVREIGSSIDKSVLRREEIRNRTDLPPTE